VIGATNLAGSLDKALQRPGRFDREVVVDLPDVEGRRQIIDHYLQKVVADKEAIDTQMLAQGTIGMSGADLSNLVNEAALRCVAEGRDSVTMEDLQWAKDKIGMGRERKSAVMMPESLRLTAYHEGGHALVSLLTEGSMEIEKATIMPRGRALGYVLSLPTGDQTGQTKKQLLANLDVAMGGRAAEELIFGKDHVTSGASSDIQQASRIARGMVEQYGMNSVIGMVQPRSTSNGEDFKNVADEEVKKMLDESYARVLQLLKSNRPLLEQVARNLIEYETVTGEELRGLVKGQKIERALLPPQPPSAQPTK